MPEKLALHTKDTFELKPQVEARFLRRVIAFQGNKMTTAMENMVTTLNG